MKVSVTPRGVGFETGKGVAQWRRIADALQADIAGHVLEPGDQMPTEAGVAARFGVNRHTARRALEELSRAGLIRIEQGRGSFVAEDVLDYVVGARTRFSEWIRRHNREPSGRVLTVQELAAPAAIADGLDHPGRRTPWCCSNGSGWRMAGRSACPSHYFPLATGCRGS